MSNNQEAIEDLARVPDISGPGSGVMTAVYMQIESLSQGHPAWYDRFEATDFNLCDALELIEMLETAPDATSRGFLAGVLASRMSIAQDTGRPLF